MEQCDTLTPDQYLDIAFVSRPTGLVFLVPNELFYKSFRYVSLKLEELGAAIYSNPSQYQDLIINYCRPLMAYWIRVYMAYMSASDGAKTADDMLNKKILLHNSIEIYKDFEKVFDDYVFENYDIHKPVNDFPGGFH